MLLYLEAALVYWVICLGLAAGQSRIERRLERYVAH
jgi:cystine transport system permease protein